MSSASPDALVALVAHARRVPAVERARFATRLRDELDGNGLMLETCHRVEAYAICPGDRARLGLEATLPEGGEILVGDRAVRHAIAVAVGRDSVVLGEDQILQQLRESVEVARAAGVLDPTLERLFALALQAGRRARSWHQGPRRSLADVALALIERRTGSLRGRDLLIVGAGRMGRLAARAAVASGAMVSVANRSIEGSEALTAATGARTEVFDPGERAGGFAGIVVALAGPWPIGPDTVAALAATDVAVVDLSVPAAVPETAIEALGRRFVSADALALADDEPATFEGRSATRLESLIDRTTVDALAWLNGRDGRAAAEALTRRADRDREAELTALWGRLPDLDPESREAIVAMTQHLTSRLLREPLKRLGRDSDGRAVRDIFAL